MLRRIARRSILAGLSALVILALPAAATAQAAPAPSGSAQQSLTRSQLSTQVDASFKSVDANGDKMLTTAEIDAAQKRQIAQAQATIAKRMDAEFAKLDANKDGQLSLTEFKAVAPTPKVAPASEMLTQLDKNKDGKVSQDEFRAVPLANFDRLDTNKDGAISAEEQAAVKQR